jgi:hypothetical protein
MEPHPFMNPEEAGSDAWVSGWRIRMPAAHPLNGWFVDRQIE